MHSNVATLSHCSGSAATLDDIALVFKPLHPETASHFRLSKRWDKEFDVGQRLRVMAAYKRKADKIQPVDQADPSGENPHRSMLWKTKFLRSIAPIRQPGLDPYGHLITPRATAMARGARLTPERVQNLKIGTHLTGNERALLLAVLFNREAALGWDFSHIGHIKREVAPPQKIRTVEHKAWQAPGFHVPKALEPKVIEILKERLNARTLEQCHGPYRNPWFLVKKSEKGKYRLINAAMLINKVTIRDANIPPNVEDFVEEFAGLKSVSLVDMQSGYDQIPLDITSRDLTGFQTPLGLLRNCTIIQGGTNSVAQFCRIATQILEDLIPQVARVFVDDIGVKGPRTDYGGAEALPGIRQYILETIQNLDKVLTNVEAAGGCVSGQKSQFVVEFLKIVGFICGPDGRTPESGKVLKIVEWPPCTRLEDARAFIGICVYFRLWIEGFALIAAPIYALFKKNVPFLWEETQQEAMDALKLCLTTSPAIQPIDYESVDTREVILATDASEEGWGSCLMQVALDGIRRYICRYDSGVWSPAEAAYDAGKRECRGLLKALKKTRQYLYGIHFVIEVDARTLVAQLNKSAADVPGALLNRWLAWIRYFDFDVRHVPGKKHLVADGLSRRPWTAEDDESSEESVEEFLDSQFMVVGVHFAGARLTVAPGAISNRNRQIDLPGVTPGSSTNPEQPEEDSGSVLNPASEYSEKHERFAIYLATLRRPGGLNARQFTKFKKEALKFLVRDGELFRRGSKNVPMRRVIDKEEQAQEIITYQHDYSGHKGIEGTYRRVAALYWWEGLYKDCKAYCQSCHECQAREGTLKNDTVYSTYSTVLFEKIAVDVVKMPVSGGKGYFVCAREDVSGWAEARAFRGAGSAAVAKFIWEDVITRHGVFGKLVCDGGPENKLWVDDLVNLYGVKKVLTSAYNPRANGMVERGHKPIIDSLSKMTGGGDMRNWPDFLHAVLWADRTTIRQSTGKTPFELLYGYHCVLPVETRLTTWNTLPWETVRTRGDLLAMRAQQLLRREEDLEEATARVERMRRRSKEYQDEALNAEDRMYQPGDLVLLHDTKWKEDHSAARKLGFWWTGPYRVTESNHEKGNYFLSELDGSLMQGTVPGRRLKLYRARELATTSLRPLSAEHSDDSDSSSEISTDSGDERRIPVPLVGRRPIGTDAGGDFSESPGQSSAEDSEKDESSDASFD